MIPRDYITEWRAQAPWLQDFQVEQDLVISRALLDIFRHPYLRQKLALRGGTALYKLYVHPQIRYSEDIDLVQVSAESAGSMMSAIREVLDPWLDRPKWKQTEGRVTFFYRFSSENVPSIPLKLKVEINTREHFAVYGFVHKPFTVSSRWFEGTCEIKTYVLEELLATKLRALYQRRKGRDLVDLFAALEEAAVNTDRIVAAFLQYMLYGGHNVTRVKFEKILKRNCLTRSSMPTSAHCSHLDLLWTSVKQQKMFVPGFTFLPDRSRK